MDLAEASKTLQDKYAGIRIGFGKMGTRKTLTADQRQTTADCFDADPDFMGSSKKLVNTKDPRYKAVTRILTRTREYWQSCTIPYPEEGIRLLNRERLEEFRRKIETLRDELNTAVQTLWECYEEIKGQAEAKLGRLYNPADYPRDIRGLFRIDWDMPSLTPPEWAKTTNPRLYEELSKKVAARFDSAVQLAEEAFTAELVETIDKLQGKLAGLDDGTEKRLKESTLDNLTEFFTRFRTLNLHSSQELDELVEKAEAILKGKDPIGGKSITRDDLRNSQAIRADVRTKLSAVSAQLEGLMTTAPRRAITRRKPTPTDPPSAPVAGRGGRKAK
jgi:hypothetical protein